MAAGAGKIHPTPNWLIKILVEMSEDQLSPSNRKSLNYDVSFLAGVRLIKIQLIERKDCKWMEEATH